MSEYKNRVAIYLRKSRQDPEDESIEETLARHHDMLMKCAKQQELNIVQIYKEVVSGDGLFTRPQMLQLLQDIESDKYTAILCVAIDRLGRSSQKDGGIILETIQEHNVFIITPQRTYNLNDDLDEQSVEMQSFIARQELKSIKRRLQAGSRMTLEQGYHTYEPPYGYERTYINRKPTLKIKEPEAEAIRIVFDMYVNQGIGTTTIARTLDSLGYKPKFAPVFTRNTISSFLRNPTYIGKIVWNREKHIRPKSLGAKHRTVKNPESDWIVADGVHPAIIDKKLYDKAQEIMNKRAHPPVDSRKQTNPYAGLLFCANCGKPLQQLHGNPKRINYIACQTPGCVRSTQTRFVDDYILNLLDTLIADCSVARKTAQSNPDKKILTSALTKAKANLNTLIGQRSKLHDLLEQGVYSTEVFLERSKILAENIIQAENLVKDLEYKIADYSNMRTAADVLPELAVLSKQFYELSVVDKNRLLKQIFKRITYNKDKTHATDEFDAKVELNFIV